MYLHYELSTDFEIIESTLGRKPWSFDDALTKVHPAVVERLKKLAVGELLELWLDASVAFGPINEQLRFEVAATKLGEQRQTIIAAKGFEAMGPDRKRHFFRFVEALDNGNLVFDGNSPWAGQAVCFRAKIVQEAQVIDSLDSLDGTQSLEL